MANIGVTQYGEALSLAIRNLLSNTPINQTYKDHPLFDTLKSNAKSASGPEMQLPVLGGSVAGPEYTNASGLFTPAVSGEIVGSAKYTWSKPLVGHIRLRWQDLEENAGKTQLTSKLKVHVDDLMEQNKIKIVDLLHSENGDLPTGGFASLDTICNAAVTTVGGIDSTTTGNSYWTPVTEDDPASDPKLAIRQMVQAITKNAKGVRPDVVHVGQNLWDAVLEYLDDRSVITGGVGGSSQELEWESVRFAGVELRWDYDCPDDRAYFLHTPSLYFQYLEDNFMKPQEEQAVYEVTAGVAQNSLDKVYPVVTVMSVGTNQRRANGLITGYGV